MRNEYVNYADFNMIELIDEVKTRIIPPFRADDILHGCIIVGKNYFDTCDELRNYLECDDKKEKGDKCLNCILE